MKKLILASIISMFFGTAMVFQANQVFAESSINTPLTGPITNPITYYRITGNVSRVLNRIVQPEKNVTIEATNTQNNTRVSTLTDKSGNYSILVPSGEYIVRALNTRSLIFKPGQYIVTVLSSNISNINFQASK